MPDFPPAGLGAALTSLHFLRPQWLLALLLLPVLLGWWRVRRRRSSAWQDIVDPHLLPHLLVVDGGRRSRIALVAAALAWTLAVVALAGPSWRKSTQPLWRSQAPLVIALDLSGAAMATDLPPSRLARARAKLASLLEQRTGGAVGLVVFAGDAFTVAPLTEDPANVALFLDALRPDVMPVEGHRVDRAIAWSAELLRRAGAKRGDILLLTDRADATAVEAAGAAARDGFRVSVLGVGSEAGGAYARGDGTLVPTRLDASSLRDLAARGGGTYAAVRLDDADLRALDVLEADAGAMTDERSQTALWQDEGYWLLPPLMLLALFAFRRRGGALSVVLACALLPGLDANAADLWRRADQAEHARIEEGNAAYRSGDYPRAAALYAGADDADAHYNRGNALAKAGRYEQALRAYDEALHRQPRMPDALANRRAVEEAMKRQPPKGGQQSSPDSGERGQGSGGPQSQQESAQSGPQKNGPQNNAPQKNGPQKNGPQKNGPQSGAPSPSQTPRDASGKSQGQPQGSGKQSGDTPPGPADAERQRQADAAQRERMQQALREARQRGGSGRDEQPVESSETPGQRERRLANEAWLRRVPDDPGGLLRAKFRLEHERRKREGRADE